MIAITDERAALQRCARMVSPRQAAIGSLIGGPIAFSYFIGRNYIAIGDRRSARKTFLICALALFGWNIAISLVAVMPEPALIVLSFGFQATPIALVFAAHHIARDQIATLPRRRDAYSNVHIALGAALGLVATIACVLPSLFFVAAATLGGFR
jgi:hypothetical protein